MKYACHLKARHTAGSADEQWESQIQEGEKILETMCLSWTRLSEGPVMELKGSSGVTYDEPYQRLQERVNSAAGFQLPGS